MPTRFQSWCQRIVASFLVLILAHNAVSQDGTLLPEIDQYSGLHSNGVRCIKIDPKGRVWIGTDNGLNVLNTTSSAHTNIITSIGSNSIWAINFKDSLVFIGTRFNGLYIISHASGKTIKHYPSSQISLIRKIKILEGSIFVLTNSGPYKWDNNGLYKLNIVTVSKSDFIIDMFKWENEFYGVTYPTHQIKKLNSNTFTTDETKNILGTNAKLTKSSFYTAETSGGRLYLGAIDERPFLAMIEKKGSPVIVKTFESLGLGFIIWDIAIHKGKIAVALGDIHTNSKGLVYMINPEMPHSPVQVQDYVNCVAIDSLTNTLYYGTLDKGLYQISAFETSTFKKNPTESEFIKRKQQTNNYEKWTKPYTFGDTLLVVQNEKIEFYIQSTGKLFFSIPRDKRFPYNYSNALLLLGSSIYTFDNYGYIYKYDLKKRNGWAIEQVESSLPYPQRFGNKIILLNREKGFNVLTESDSYSLTCSDKSIPFATDFTLIHDTLYTLSRNTLKAFLLNEKTKELTLIKEFTSINTIDGFIPKWIISQANKIYLLNDNGILNIDANNGAPVHYYYFGNFGNLKKPIVDGDSLKLAYNRVLQNISFTTIKNFNGKKQKLDVEFSFPKSINENLGFQINIRCPEYLLQNKYLKAMEIWQNGKLKETRYSITSTFNFTNGFQYGDYDLFLKVGSNKKKDKLSITLPLNRNPYFFGALAFFTLVFIILALKTRNDKKALNKKLLENRMQVLKQNLNPHFVYNSMNLINSLILEEKYDDAVQVVSEFSKLQRTFLETNNKDVISLKEEFDFLEVYLKLQQRRFDYDNSFSYSIKIGEGIDINTITLPPLLLQPLVENAIKHGIIGYEESERHIIIEVSGVNPIVISVEDNGNGTEKSKREFGLGHKLVEERIHLFNANSRHRLVIEFNKAPLRSSSGYRVELVYTKSH